MKPSSQAAAVALCALALAACGADSGDREGPDRRTEGGAGAASIELLPSRRARREIPTRRLRVYRQAGREAGVDWSVLAAIDVVERGRSAPLSIGYTLSGLGAASGYEGALRKRGGSLAYAREVLRIADRYRGRPARGKLPRGARGPLLRPVRGSVLLAFGERSGLFHDGLTLGAEVGAPVRAAAAGLVMAAGPSDAYGHLVCVLHRFDPPFRGERELTTCYGNVGRPAVEPGRRVAAGRKLASVRCGNPCGNPSLHFQVRRGAGFAAPAINPAPLLERPDAPRRRR